MLYAQLLSPDYIYLHKSAPSRAVVRKRRDKIKQWTDWKLLLMERFYSGDPYVVLAGDRPLNVVSHDFKIDPPPYWLR